MILAMRDEFFSLSQVRISTSCSPGKNYRGVGFYGCLSQKKILLLNFADQSQQFVTDQVMIIPVLMAQQSSEVKHSIKSQGKMLTWWNNVSALVCIHLGKLGVWVPGIWLQIRDLKYAIPTPSDSKLISSTLANLAAFKINSEPKIIKRNFVILNFFQLQSDSQVLFSKVEFPTCHSHPAGLWICF